MEYFTERTSFYGNQTPKELVERFESPLYVYNEGILRERCREMARLIDLANFKADYSIKANSNLALLKIVHEEGLHADAMSPGEIHLLEAAGFLSHEIFYVGNNVSDDEMRFAIERGIAVSVDSLAQLERFGVINPGGEVAVRFNPGIGAGHHAKVMTAGKKTKFGVAPYDLDEVQRITRRYDLKIIGINQHIGSLFLEGDVYLQATQALLAIAENFDGLEFVDLGGGFGVPYRKQEGQARLDLVKLGKELTELLTGWTNKYGREIRFKIEPGRYLSAECGVLLGTVHAIKQLYDHTYIGTDLGFNALMRPVLYNAYHEIEAYRDGKLIGTGERKTVQVVGNICETGDIMASDRSLPYLMEGDLLGVMDAGAYGYAMSSNYNCRLRPAEVLVRMNGEAELIRRRDTFEDLMRNFI